MAVYTEVSDDELAAFLTRYDLGGLVSLKGIAEGVENSNFLLRTETGTYILTLYEKRVNPNDLPFFIGLMEHLAAAGITCPQPVKARNGEALGDLAGRKACIVTFLDGVWVKRPTVTHCRQLGEVLAKLHLAGRDFKMARPNALSVGSWRPLFDQSRDRADEVVPGLVAEIDADLDALEDGWPADLPAGVIHADLFTDNVFFLKDRLSGLIDFYFACTDSFAYDVAICLNAWCFEPTHELNVTKSRAFLTAYAEIRPFTDAEIAALPMLARGAAMRFFLTRLYDWLTTPAGALVKKKDPLEYLRKMRFHRSVASAADYGLQVEGIGR
ncbi:homoserine kinase [Chthonobacter rhizosphaerae]|uniref:homoserine kinase n=1 Tax=Chthonobacter rhizosphaerae TaxID=2735553 RepID=UPI0015EF0975|nr:homoserine kinase [Chthonobacter rhizosphaerae]